MINEGIGSNDSAAGHASTKSDNRSFDIAERDIKTGILVNTRIPNKSHT